MHNIGTQCQGNNKNQNALVAAVAKASAATVVVASVPGAIVLPWVHDVAAVVTNFLPGQQGGNAIADVLFGAVNPSGRLPLTFPNKDGEWQTSPAQVTSRYAPQCTVTTQHVHASCSHRRHSEGCGCRGGTRQV